MDPTWTGILILISRSGGNWAGRSSGKTSRYLCSSSSSSEMPFGRGIWSSGLDACCGPFFISLGPTKSPPPLGDATRWNLADWRSSQSSYDSCSVDVSGEASSLARSEVLFNFTELCSWVPYLCETLGDDSPGVTLAFLKVSLTSDFWLFREASPKLVFFRSWALFRASSSWQFVVVRPETGGGGTSVVAGSLPAVSGTSDGSFAGGTHSNLTGPSIMSSREGSMSPFFSTSWKSSALGPASARRSATVAT